MRHDYYVMRANRYPIFLSILTVVLILLALAAESVYFSDFEYHFRTRMFNKILAEKETIIENCLNAMKPILAFENHHGSVSENNVYSIAEQNLSLIHISEPTRLGMNSYAVFC